MKMCAQRKAGRRQWARRLADLVFKMVARVIADEYAIFKNKFSPVSFANLEQIIAYPHRVYKREAFFTPHTGLKHHNRLMVPCASSPVARHYLAKIEAPEEEAEILTSAYELLKIIA